MNSKKKIELLVVKERSGEPTLFDQLIKGFRFLTETLLFISVGMVVTVWEKFGKILKAESEVRSIESPDSLRMARPPEPEVLKIKTKVPVLPIDDYQQLTAEQIIKRMKGLTRNQLETVGLFESTHRNRKSILEMIERLQDRVES